MQLIPCLDEALLIRSYVLCGSLGSIDGDVPASRFNKDRESAVVVSVRVREQNAEDRLICLFPDIFKGVAGLGGVPCRS